MYFEPLDKNGKRIEVGDWVRLTEIPPDVINLPEEIQLVFEKALGKTFQIERFDSYGLAEIDLTVKVAKFEWIWVEPQFLVLFRRKTMTEKITVYEKPT